MKKTILILLLLISTTTFTQEVKKCVEVKVEKLDAYRVKVTKINNCVEPKEITIRAYLKNEWIKKQKKRKKRKND
tara:strand:- start:136 stop:360 length:225 start_codon:yes stop_codon:yes gene_type:complete